MQITQGDAVTLRVLIRTGNTGPGVDLTGATFETSFPAADGGLAVITNGAHTIETPQAEPEHTGWVGIALTAEQSAGLKLGKFLSYVVKVTIGSTVKHYQASKGLSVLSASPIEECKPQSNILIGGCL